MKTSRETVLIVDFGSQYTQLIARRVRELNIFSKIVPNSVTLNKVIEESPKAIILSGGPSSVYENKSLQLSSEIMELKIPMLGICYGLQLLIHYFGGKVVSNGSGEYGPAFIETNDGSQIFNGVTRKSKVWMSHGDIVESIPTGWDVTSRTTNGVISSVENKEKRRYGTQFHPEVSHTDEGGKILSNFLYQVAKCEGNWTSESFVKEAIENIRSQVGKEKVLCGISGGVDSAVVAKLLSISIGEKLIPVFVDHGLCRKDDVTFVETNVAKDINTPIRIVDESKKFLRKLSGVVDPEKKRKIIGEEFIRTFEKIARKDGGIPFLAQGTLYPDVIESGGVRGVADVIKTHHNVGGLPSDMKFKLVEPLRDLFKDEVRRVGKILGVSDEILTKHPFPGPGLAVRIIGKITAERLRILRESDDLFLQLLKKHHLYHEIWQAFCILIPIRTVGVMGDQRTYEHVIAIRAVTSTDGMTAKWFPFSEEILSRISTTIVNNVDGVNRIVYDICSKPPSTIEWE